MNFVLILDITIAVLFTVSFVKSRITFSDGLGIFLVAAGLYAMAMLMDYMNLPVSAVTIFILAVINTFMSLFLRARRLGAQ